jgi:hypothetical protein
LRLTSLAQVGLQVRAGQIIGFLGNTDPMPATEHRGSDPDDAVWPHLRLTIRDRDGVRLDADRLVFEAQRRQSCHVGLGPWSVPIDTRLDDELAVYGELADTDVSAIINGGWTIHDDGRVSAYGKSALILPPEGCVWEPDEPFGAGAAGNHPPETWGEPVAIKAQFWVNSATADETFTPPAPLRGR